MNKIGAKVLGSVIVDAHDTILRVRLIARAPRQDQELGSAQLIDERLADHYENIISTTSLLEKE